MLDPSSYLPVAVRAWSERTTTKKAQKGRGQRRRRALAEVRHVLFLDTETTVEAAQGLLFGSFRYCRIDGTTVTCVAEGLFHADDLPERDPGGMHALRAYAASRKADVDLTYLSVEPSWQLQLLSRAEFVEQWLYRVGYQSRGGEEPALIVMFNAPFDLSRLAMQAAEARADMYGGFSLLLWVDQSGAERSWRPRVTIKAIDSKRSLKKLRRLERGAGDFAGHLLDLRTLVFALTGESHSLASAATVYGTRRKGSTSDLGTITADSVDYCRQDVAVTAELFQQALSDFATHPIELQATRAYSPASIAKAYLRAMGIEPRLQRQPDFDRSLLGLAMSAFYGGRAEVHLRHQPLPINLVDFTSMYPSVDQLLDLWPLVTADKVQTVDVTDEIRQLLATITLEQCFEPERWQDWVVIAEIVPDGDVLPVRAAYGPTSREVGDHGRPSVQDWSIGLNPLHTDQPMAYPLPDLIASTLHTGKPPHLVRAVRFVPGGSNQPNLQPLRLREQVPVDPRSDDFLRLVVEGRQEIRQRTRDHEQACRCPDCRLQAFLKVLANAGSYGIFAEIKRSELPRSEPETVTVTTGSSAFPAKVTAPEEPGEFCFPPIAACITGAARLMLTLLERLVTDAGGSWMFCDTDSMAIVATPTGGLIACPGGPHQLPDGRAAVKALSHGEVDRIRQRVNALNPYDPAKVPDLLKRELSGMCLAISAKRYAIWDTADPELLAATPPVKLSQHGLGRYLDPISPREERRNNVGQLQWILDAWQWVAAAMRNPHTDPPPWANLPALSRVSVSSITLWKPFRQWNAKRPWPEQIKPFNFLLVADLDPFGYPPGVDPHHFRLIAPYTDNPEEWTSLEWRNLYDPDGRTYRITTDPNAPAEPDLAVVKSYQQVLREYRLHPERKFQAPSGKPCRRVTRGLLQRRPVHLAGPIRHIGKEANKLDDVQAGLHSELDEVLTEYNDPNTDVLHRLALPALHHLSGRELARRVHTDRRTIDRIRAGQKPRPDLHARLLELASDHARQGLTQHEPPEQVASLLAAPPLVLLAIWQARHPT